MLYICIIGEVTGSETGSIIGLTPHGQEVRKTELKCKMSHNLVTLSFSHQIILNQSIKIYLICANCLFSPSRSQPYKIAYTSETFCSLQSGEHNCNLVLVFPGHVSCTVAGFFFGRTFFLPQRSPLQETPTKRSLDYTLVILLLSGCLKLPILATGCWWPNSASLC